MYDREVPIRCGGVSELYGRVRKADKRAPRTATLKIKYNSTSTLPLVLTANQKI